MNYQTHLNSNKSWQEHTIQEVMQNAPALIKNTYFNVGNVCWTNTTENICISFSKNYQYQATIIASWLEEELLSKGYQITRINM